MTPDDITRINENADMWGETTEFGTYRIHFTGRLYRTQFHQSESDARRRNQPSVKTWIGDPHNSLDEAKEWCIAHDAKTRRERNEAG